MTEIHAPHDEHASKQYIELAQQYAELRWCLDDPSLIEENCRQAMSTATSLPSPKILIDEFAEEFELDDPFSLWGIGDENRRTAVKTLEASILAIYPAAKRPRP